MFRKILLFIAIVTVSGCAPMFEEGGLLSQQRWSNGEEFANRSMIALIKGDIDMAELNVRKALHINPKHPYALLVGALVYENTGRPQRARQYYEDILAYRPSVLSTLGNMKQLSEVSVSDIAREKLQVLELRENKLAWPGPGEEMGNDFTANGQPMQRSHGSFKGDTFAPQNPYQATANAYNGPSGPAAKTVTVPSFAEMAQSEDQRRLFDEADQNAIVRFVTFRKLAEEGLITRDEFLLRRKENVGALLPLTRKAPAAGLGRAVPSVDMIVSRLKALRQAFEGRSISAREHAAERSMILDALLPAVVGRRARPTPHPKDLLLAATAVRRLESLQEMGLITTSEMKEESEAIESSLRIMGQGEQLDTAKEMSGNPSGLLVPELSTPRSLNSSQGKKKIAGNMGVHMASFKSRNNAMNGARVYQKKFGKIIGGFEPHVEETNLGAGKGNFYRLSFGPVGSEKDAKEVCKRLKRRDQYCVPSFIN